MSKGLEDLAYIKNQLPFYDGTGFKLEIDESDFKTIEKDLKALEIIRNKKVDVWCFTRDCMNLSYKQFLQSRGLDAITSYTGLTLEEYNLLKEVLS